MTEIIPAILESSLSSIEERLESVKGAAPAVQLDVVDGHFAPARTWPFSDSRQHEEFERIISGEEGLPLWQDFEFEIDLMVGKPSREAARWIAAGASRLIVHAGADALEVVQSLQSMRAPQAALPLMLGVALPCDAELSDFKAYEALVDFVQVMGIARVGFQGEVFDERALSLVGALHEAYPELQIQVDGGVKFEQVRALSQAGASRLVVGSGVFSSLNPKQALKELEDEANS